MMRALTPSCAGVRKRPKGLLAFVVAVVSVGGLALVVTARSEGGEKAAEFRSERTGSSGAPAVAQEQPSHGGTQSIAPMTNAGRSASAASACRHSECIAIGGGRAPVVAPAAPVRNLLDVQLAGLGQGDATVLQSIALELESCIDEHRAFILSELAWGPELYPENACSPSDIADITRRVEALAKTVFGAGGASGAAQHEAWHGWLTATARLEDFILQMHELPPLLPTADGAIDFTQIPRPDKRSPVWTRVEEHSQAMIR